MKKKILIAVGVLLGLFVVAAIALPFLIDVDKFRPQIVQAVNNQINGEFKMGKLELSLWGGVKVRVASLYLRANSAPKPILETNSAYFEIPIMSILRMSPEVVAVLSEPKVDIIKSATGKLNVMALMKEGSISAPPPEKPGLASPLEFRQS